MFVNPLQFSPNEDFARYPRTFEADCDLAEQCGASAIWCPDEEQIYPGGIAETWRIQAPNSLQSGLCGSTRPGHFDGVVTVVCRLLALAKPHQLFLGEKDWQQLTILRRMVLDLGLAVRVRSVPTVRDGDGLASSSRNRYLNAQQRQQGVLFAKVLRDASAAFLHTATPLNPEQVRRRLEEGGLNVEYVEVVDPWLLQPSKPNEASLTLLAAAVRCGSTRLIDHAFLMTRSPLVAIDGPAGAGKSTVFNVLTRLVEPSAGAAQINGVPITDYNLADLRGLFSVVTQDAALFDETLRDNILLGRDDVDEAHLKTVLDSAHVTDFLPSLPNGLDSPAGPRGSNLSGGQRQRVAIARALLRDTPILLLDEATSALDTKSEAIVQKALEKLSTGRTTLVIAHRLSTIRNADSIIVMDQGRVVDQGNHETLLARGGIYADLHSLQFSQSESQTDA